MNVLENLERGRESYKRRAWAEAYQALSLADQGTPLGVEDLELLATSAYLIGRDDDYLRALIGPWGNHPRGRAPKIG